LTSGEVRFVKAVEGGAELSGSLKMSLGDTVCMEPEETEGLLTDVNAEAE
jgi:hypothetical protein